MDVIKFGPSGNSQWFYRDGNKSSVQAPAWLRKIGLQAYEYSFGRGVTMGEETARRLGDEAAANGITVSVHAPYYVNFASLDPQKRENSYGYILTSLERLDHMRGSHCVMHTATCAKLERDSALTMCRESLVELAARIRAAGFGHLTVCPETMGKYNQIGTAEEIIDFCTLDEMFIPCFDFGHINSYLQGALDYDAYRRILDYAFDRLPAEKVRGMHVHFSKIQYGKCGEIRHLNFDDAIYGPDFEVFAEIICRYGLTPTVICESAERMAEDAAAMRDIFWRKKQIT